MNKALLTFSNGETLELSEDQLITPISKLIKDNGYISISQNNTFTIWYHSHDGFIPCICELLCKSDFFYLLDDNTKVYNSNAVVSIQNI